MEQIAGKWNAAVGGDPNIFDLYWIGRALNVRFPFELPAAEVDVATGIRVVETVERTMIPPGDHIVRFLPPEQVGERAVATLGRVFPDLAWVGNFEAVLTAALHVWCGCIGMAKSMRRTFVASPERIEASYTPALRDAAHSVIRDIASRHPWVAKGMTLAKPLELSRGKTEDEIIDDWVPRDSPYWIR